jgi:DNA-directed RNA polymerase specialized sigma subunit
MTLSSQDPEEDSTELSEVAETEHEYLHERLRQELGREPTEEELDEWLRQHTEGY